MDKTKTHQNKAEDKFMLLIGRMHPIFSDLTKCLKASWLTSGGSKLLMITARLSAPHSAPAEPLPVVKVTNLRGRESGELIAEASNGPHEASMT